MKPLVKRALSVTGLGIGPKGRQPPGTKAASQAYDGCSRRFGSLVRHAALSWLRCNSRINCIPYPLYLVSIARAAMFNKKPFLTRALNTWWALEYLNWPQGLILIAGQLPSQAI